MYVCVCVCVYACACVFFVCGLCPFMCVYVYVCVYVSCVSCLCCEGEDGYAYYLCLVKIFSYIPCT